MTPQSDAAAVGPVRVDYLELHRLANATASSADDLARLGLTIGATSTDPDLLASRVLNPVGAARVDWAIAQVAAALTTLVARLNSDALLLEAAVIKERAADGSLVWQLGSMPPGMPLGAFTWLPMRVRDRGVVAPIGPLSTRQILGRPVTALLNDGDGGARRSGYQPTWADRPIPSLATALAQIQDIWLQPGAIAIQQIAGPVPRYVVQLPGMQTYGSASHPIDLPGAVAAVSSASAAYDKAVVKAMQYAGVPNGAEVMLVGHSLGGIAAMNLAGNRMFNGEYVRVTHVITAGSPVSAKTVVRGSGTRVLEIENLNDIVPHLDNRDSAARPQRRDRLTYTFADRYPMANGTHYLSTYVDHLGQIEQGPNPLMRDFTADAARYLQAPTTTRVFTLTDRER